MTHARIEKRETKWAIVVYSESVKESERLFDSEDEADHFLTVAGWDKTGAKSWWRLNKTHGSFIAMPVLGNSIACWNKLDEYKFGEYGLFVRAETCSFDMYSFYFVVHLNGTVLEEAGDPVLALVDNDHVKIESVGCWFTDNEAVDMAVFFFHRLEKRYGRELFSEAIHAHILRNLHREKTR